MAKHIIDVHDVMHVIDGIMRFNNDYVIVVPELIMGEILVAAQAGRPPVHNPIRGLIVLRECYETSSFCDLAADFITEGAARMAEVLDRYGIDGQIVNYMLLPNQRDLILEERVNNGRIRTQGGLH